MSRLLPEQTNAEEKVRSGSFGAYKNYQKILQNPNADDSAFVTRTSNANFIDINLGDSLRL